MPRGDKSAYTDKQKREAEHIEEGYERRGRSHEEAERIAWSTVNAESGGGKLSGSGRRGNNGSAAHLQAGGHKGGQSRSREERSDAAKRGWATRRSKDALK